MDDTIEATTPFPRGARSGRVLRRLAALALLGVSPWSAAASEGVPRAWRFDFGTASSLLAENHLRVTPGSAYARTPGYGWLPGPEPITAVARTAGNALEHDANLSRRATFRVDVPDGFYAVTVLVGDTVPHAPMLIAVEGQAMTELESPGVGEWDTLSKRLHVHDGHVDVLLLSSDRPGPQADPAAPINALTVEAIPLPPDPIAWSIGHGRTLYRRATTPELVRNRWPIGTTLVVNRDLRSFDDRPVRVFAPTGGRNGLSRRVAFAAHEAEMPVVELGFGVRSVSRITAFRRYETRAGRRPAIVLLADEETGAFWGRVGAGRDGVGPLEIRSGEASWQLDPIALPGGLVPVPTDLYGAFPGQASPGPGDELATPSGDAYGFALVGEIKWCTANRHSWATQLAGRALHVREGFQACPEGFCPISTDVAMEQRGLYCNMAPSQELAEDCAQGTCPTGDAGNPYSYLGCRWDAECYMDNVEANLLQARAEGHTVREVDLAQVVHDGAVQLVQEDVQDSPTVRICGMARFPAGLVNGVDLEAVGRGGTSVVGGGVPDECALSTSTHEFAHNHGAIHERANAAFATSDCEGTVMTWGAGKCNVFSFANAATLSDCGESNIFTLNFWGTIYMPGLGQIERGDCPLVADEPLVPAW